jgi:hypothetical protein
MILAELASRLFSLGILVNQDAIRSESSIENTEALSALEGESKLSDGIPERVSQQAGSVNLRVMFGILTEAILGKHGNETRSYKLVSTLSLPRLWRAHRLPVSGSDGYGSNLANAILTIRVPFVSHPFY